MQSFLLWSHLRRYPRGFWLAVVVSLLTGLAWAAEPPVLAEAGQLEAEGQFTNAAARLRAELRNPDLSGRQRRLIEYDLDRLDRIRKDYPLTREALWEALDQALRDASPEEFERWVTENRFDRRVMDGEERFMASSVSNLFFRYPELAGRRLKPGESAEYQRRVWRNCRNILDLAACVDRSNVPPARFVCTMTVTVKPGLVPAGETIRCWLPIPRPYPTQRDIAIGFSQPVQREIADVTRPIRSVFLEQPSAGASPTVFSVDYAYTSEAQWFDLQPGRSRPLPGKSVAVLLFTNEAPHIQFTPAMRALAREVGGSESNPVLRARRFYDWISTNIKYSYALEYSTVRNLGEACLRQRYGDCGQQAFLFMTLCRLSGIPARWQSGWFTMPGGQTIHDWCEIYLAPWGWVPVDPYMGGWAMQYAVHLKPAERKLVRDFYFGGLDQYRMIANSDHCQELQPEKRGLRADTVDFQRGELEAGGRHLYFDQFDYRLTVQEIPTTVTP